MGEKKHLQKYHNGLGMVCFGQACLRYHLCCYNFAAVEATWWHQGLSMVGLMHY